MATSFGSLALPSASTSAPSFQLTRLSCLDRESVLVCDRDELTLLHIPAAACAAAEPPQPPHSSQPHARPPGPLLDDGGGEGGGFLEADAGNVLRTRSHRVDHSCSLRAAPPASSSTAASSSSPLLQSVCVFGAGRGALTAAAVSSQGDLVVCPIQPQEENGCFSFGTPSYSSAACTRGHGYGYVSLCHSRDRLVSAHYLSKQLTWNDVTTLAVTRQSTLFQNPTCVTTNFNSTTTASSPDASSAVVIVSEGANIAVYDERQHSKGGCVFRENDNNNSGILWSILPLADNNRVAAAGNEKIVRIYDTRTWKSITKWKAPHKFDVIKLLPCSNNSLQLYAAGRDNEVLLCDLSPAFATVQASKSKSRKHTSPADSTDAPLKRPKSAANTSENLSTILDSTAGNIPHIAAKEPHPSTLTASGGTELLPMQLPASSKLRISHHRGIRAESMWAGLDVVASGQSGAASDRLVGLCCRGKLYIADNANLMKLAI